MEQVLFELLKQSAVVIALGVGNWAQWKEKKELKTDMIQMIQAHIKEKRELTNIIQSNNTQNTESLTRISVSLETIKDNLNE